MADEEDEETEDERRRRERIPAAFLPAPRARAAGSVPGTAAIDAFASEYLIGLQCEQEREAPSFWQSGQENGPDAPKSLAYKGQLCKMFFMGICQKGEECFDAHGDSELQNQPSAAGDGFFELSAAMRELHRPEANPALLEVMRFVQQPASELAEEALRRHASPAPDEPAEGKAESPGIPKRKVPDTFAEQPSDLLAGDAKRPRGLKSQMCKFHPMGACLKGDECEYAHDASQLGAAGSAWEPTAALAPEVAMATPGGDWASMATALGVSETALLQMGYGGPSKVAQAQASLLSAAHMAGYGSMASAQPQGAANACADAGFGDYYAQVFASQGGSVPNAGGAGLQHMQPQQDQSMYKYKTVMCKFFPMGLCTKGERCTFAHFPDEIGHGGGGAVRRGPAQFPAVHCGDAYAAAMQAQAVMPQQMPQPMPGPLPGPMPQPVVVPPPNTMGPVVVPPPGQYHSATAGTQEASIEAWGQSDAWSQAAAAAAVAAMGCGQQQAMAEPLRTRGFKTQLCKFFPMGQCMKADGCTYAHGDEELRTYGAAGARRAAPTGYAEAVMPLGYAGESISSFTC